MVWTTICVGSRVVCVLRFLVVLRGRLSVIRTVALGRLSPLVLTAENAPTLSMPTHQQIALGTDYAGMWSSDENLAKELNDVRSVRSITTFKCLEELMI